MADIFYAPCIVYGMTRFYLPPWLQAEIVRSQSVDMASPPGASNAVITDIKPNQGTQISLTVQDIPATPSTATVLKWIEDLWSHMSGREFKFFVFSDRGFPNCALQTMREQITLNPNTRLPETPIQIVSAASQPDTNLQLDFDPNYATAYPYASIVGRPTGSAAVPGSIVPVTEPASQDYSANFPGQQLGANVTGEEKRYVVGGTVGSSWDIRGIQITSAENEMATGTTTYRLSTVPIGGGGGSHVDVSIANTERFSDEVAVDIPATAGDNLYLYRIAGGGHQNPEVHFRCEAL